MSISNSEMYYEHFAVPVVRRSALALPKPSSEGLSKQLWYSGPISQMNKQKTKSDSTGK